ncbi:MAG: major capsid protein [Desulfovibrio sp.]
MSLTLVEAAKRSQNPIQSAIIEMYARSSDIMMVLPFDNITGNALRYNREETLPGIGFRGVNEAYTESTGVINPQTEPLVIAGGDLDVDTFILTTMGMGQRSVQESMKVKALALAWTKQFIKGDSANDPRGYDGLQVRLVGDQLFYAGTTDGGDALSLTKLDELIDRVDNPTHLVMNKTMRRRLTAAARSSSTGGFITWEVDAFGRKIAQYADLPILIADKDNTDADILPFSEVGYTGSTATASSIYCVSLGDGKLKGIQNGDMDVRDLGELETKPAMRTRVEWFNGIAVFHGRAAARLAGVKNAAVTA